MGTEICLKVGPAMLDWSKNSRGDDHVSKLRLVLDRLFQECSAIAAQVQSRS